MITPNDMLQVIADAFFGGDITLCGLVAFSVILIAVFVISRSMMVGFVGMLPLTLVFAYLGAIPDNLMIILIVVSVLGIAITSRKVTGGDL